MWLDEVKWNEAGLVAAIVQDERTGRVLMMAWMDRQALQRSVETGIAHYFSRARQRQWKKGEASGHVQHIEELRLDCDGDAMVVVVRQEGGIACHTGRESCFYRRLDQGRWQVVDPVLRDPNVIYEYNT